MNKSEQSQEQYTLREYASFFYFQYILQNFSHMVWTVRFKLRAWIWGVPCGQGLKVWGCVHIFSMTKQAIQIGHHCKLISSSKRATAAQLFSPIRLRTIKRSARIIIGDHVSLNGTSITARSCQISIGNGTMIAPNVIIVDSDFHSQWPPDKRIEDCGLENDRSVNIGRNVWIGMNTVILKGVNIGDNVIIGAGSIVTSDISSNIVAAGNPAKCIKDFVRNE